MSTRIPLTLACGDYEIIRPLKEGKVQPDGIDLTVLTAMDSTTRHWRFLRGQEFDMAEVSASSYIMARDQGFAATAIPVFLHRRFRHGFIFINTTKGIKTPKDLIGKRIGLKQFQATAIVWMRGILEDEYGVPAKSIEWVCELDETIEFTPPPGLEDHQARQQRDRRRAAGGGQARRRAASRSDQASGAEGPAGCAPVPELQG